MAGTMFACAQEKPLVEFFADFPGAAIGNVEEVANDGSRTLVYRIEVPRQSDEKGLNSQCTWFAFRVVRHDVPLRPLRLVFHGFDGVYNGHPTKPNWEGQRLVFKIPGREWSYVSQESVVWDPVARTLTLIDFIPPNPGFVLAYTEMFTLEDLKETELWFQNPNGEYSRTKIETIGKTLEGRDIRRFTITDPSVPDAEKKHFYIMARQHAWEVHTSQQAVGLIEYLAYTDTYIDYAPGGDLCKRAVFHIVPVVDADGVENGAIRFNSKGYDTNRRWNELDTTREDDPMRALRPEVWYVKRDILRLNAEHPLSCVVNLHGDTNTDYIDAAGDPQRDWPKFRAFDAAFSATDLYDPNPNHPLTIFEQESDAVPTTFNLWWSHGIPTLMMEQKVTENRKTGKYPTRILSRKRGETLGRILCDSF